MKISSLFFLFFKIGRQKSFFFSLYRMYIILLLEIRTSEKEENSMSNKVEGVYETIDEALRAVDRLRVEGYARNDIQVITNDETRNRVDSNYKDNITPADEELDQTEDDQSFWDKIKDAFTMSGPDYEDNNSLTTYKDDIEQGQLVVLVNENNENMATTQPNTIGPDGVRDHETEQKVDSMGERPKTDHELTTDELEDYEKRY